MSSATATDARPSLTLPEDRRRAPRRPVTGWAMIAFTTENAPGRLVPVDLVDESPIGVGVMSRQAVEVGSRFELFRGSTPWPANTGRVVRCEACEGGFFIGLALQVRAVAAA